MGFRIGYTKLLTLRCWHPAYLGSMAGQVPVAPATTLTVAEKNDYLNYDFRNLLELRPTADGRATLDRYGLLWTLSTLGGWLLARDTFGTTDPGLRLQLGAYLRDPGFARATNFGAGAQEKKIFYLSNANETPEPEHDLTGGVLRDLHYRDSSPFTVRLAQTNPGTDSQIEIRDPLRFNNPVLETVAVSGGDPTTDAYQLDLRGRRAGLYRFTGANITNQTLAVGFTAEPDLLGVIELRVADWADAAFDLHFQSSNP